MRKADGQEKLYYRSQQRLFCINGEWFYQTREGDRGPFPSKALAVRDAGHYLHEMSDIAERRPAPGGEQPFGHATIQAELPPEDADG